MEPMPATTGTNGEPKRNGRSKGASAEKKTAKPVADTNGTPKKRGLSPDRMAEIRAMRKKK